MASWAKIKFFWDTMLTSNGGVVSASCIESDGDYSADYLSNWLEVGRWKSSTTAVPIYINYDAGSGNSESANYITILGHNPFSIGASVSLEASTTGLWAGEELVVLSSTSLSSDKVFHREFATTDSNRYWRLAVTGTLTDAPYMTICIWGNSTELDYVSSSFDPNSESTKATISLSNGGVVTGVYSHYKERNVKLNFSGADSVLYNKIKTWHESVGLRNFFLAWDSDNNSEDVFLVRSSETFNNPFNDTGVYRDISITLMGRAE